MTKQNEKKGLSLSEFLADLVVVLRKMAPIFVVALGGAAALVVVPQVTDIIRSFLLDPIDARTVLYQAGIFLWAFELWYSSRLLLDITEIPFHNEARGKKMMEFLAWILGMLPFAAAVLAYLAAWVKGEKSMFALLVLTGLEAIGMVLVIAFRKQLFPAFGELGAKAEKISLKKEDLFGKWGVFFLSLCLFFLVTILVVISRVSLPRFVGTNALLVIFLACIAPTMVALIYLIRNHYLPLVIGLVLLWGGFSYLNNNHAVRLLPAGLDIPRIASDEQNPLLDRFTNWAAGRKPPYIIVCVEGGGMRSAYWSSLLLSSLEEVTASNGQEGRLSEHIFAVSGVSGGSIGGAVYLALLREWISKGGGENFAMAEQSRRILGADLLSPVASGFLYPDCFQRFLPVPVAGLDRAQYLELAMEDAWKKAMSNDSFSRPFLEPWVRTAQIPYLFLNSTLVEDGTRVILTPISFGDSFNNAHDFFAEFPGYSGRLSYCSAAFLSARFPLITPTARIYPDAAKRGMLDPVWGHLCDGGYFENSGAATAFDILASIYQPGKNLYSAKNSRGNIVQAYVQPVLALKPGAPGPIAWNLPSRKSVFVVTVRNDEPSTMKPAIPFYETGHPVLTFLNTWSGRTPYSVDVLSDIMSSSNVLDINMYLSGKEVPLGWYLSSFATNAVSEYVRYLVGSAMGYDVNTALRSQRTGGVNLDAGADEANIESVRRLLVMLAEAKR